MGVQVLAANSSVVNLITPFSGISPGYPMTIGGWFCPLAATLTDLWNWTLTSSGSNGWEIFMDATQHMTLAANASLAAGTNALTLGQWYYVIGRFISATNRRITVLEPDLHAIEEVQNVVSTTPATGDKESVGGWQGSSPVFGTGIMAEIWRNNSDIQPGGAALLTSTLIQLAYKGPWSISSVAETIVWYKSFRQSIIDTDQTGDDPSFSRIGRAGWVKTGSPITGPHPPLASDYVYLNTLKQKLTV